MSIIAPILSNTFGAYTIATFVTAVFLMESMDQAWHYFNTYSDRPIIKYTVGALVALEMLHLAVSIHALYFFLITNYLNPLALLQNVWSLNVYSLIVLPLSWTMLMDYTKDYIRHHLIVLLVHLSYAMRIYHVSGKKKVIALAIGFVSLIHCALGWVVVAVLQNLAFQRPVLSEMLTKAVLASAIPIDVIIAYTLCYYLHTNRSGMKQTDRLINRLMMYTINCGVLTSILDIVTLALLIARPMDLLFFAVSQVLATVYSNSLLATLNSRKRLKPNEESNGVSSIALVTMNFDLESTPGSVPPPVPKKD
ncbi:hypothetical protein GALMADRAFT_144753 [Galerina marginata CBS 339.88]|uniref:DUF6534 domain-containing protein n=1 Tax=Galerina marginata (strain CBS 339.88) TaxID=685588 RepID=A0A067SS35_GALM3|nr:hypothetical protein GALMADRAFT_144753 [Galerina marginata CBS 339.88]